MPWLALLLLSFLAWLAAAMPASALPPIEPLRRCQALLPGFVTAPEELATLSSETHIGAPHEPSLVRFDWWRSVPSPAGPHGFIACWFLPLAETGGLWQIHALDSDQYGRLERYDIQQLHKLLRQRFRASQQPAAPPGDPTWIAVAYAGQQVVNAISLGGLYGLIAIGFTLAFAASGVMNLAIGVLFTLGAFQAFLAWLVGEAWLGDGWLLLVPAILLLSLGAGAAASWSAHRLAFRPLAGRPQAALIAATGLLIAGQELLRLLQGPKTHWLPFRDGNSWLLIDQPGFPLVVSRGHLIVLLATILLVLLLGWILQRTRFGRALRAVADDPQAAALLGVRVQSVIGGAFLLSGALAGVAGGFAFLHYGVVNFHIGLLIGFKALVAAILGGVGSVPGAFVGGLVVAAVEVAAASTGVSAWKDLLVFALLVAVLVFRPNGLFGIASEATPEGRLRRTS